MIISVVREMIKESGIKLSSVRAIAAGAPGVINQDEGVVLFSPNLPWRDYDIKSPSKRNSACPSASATT